jgi:hypothetical protein
MISGEKLPVKYIGWCAAGHHFVRIITSGSKLFRYRMPDYNGGYYLYLQVGTLDAPPEAAEGFYTDISSVDFDELAVKNYVVHCHRTDYGGWSVPYFSGSYIVIDSPLEYNTFNPDSISVEKWTPPQGWIEIEGDLIDVFSLDSFLHEYTNENRVPLLETDYETGLDEEIEAAVAERCNSTVINQLKKSGRFDTIFQENGSTIYANTDLEFYEIPAAPEVFYVIYRKFHPNGKLKEKKRFFPGVYRNVSFFIGYSLYFDENGKLTDSVRESRMEFVFAELNETTIVWFLEEEGWINTKTGEGKATFSINEHIKPHAVTHGDSRFVIRSVWEAQVDDDVNGTVGILISKDDAETSYIIKKSNGTVLKKFKRLN